jgi:predicted RecB family nuclease
MSLLSKSLYKDGRECPKRAWFGVHHRDWAKAPTDSEQARMREGVELGKMATRFFPGGVDCRIRGTDEENATQSAWLLSQGGDVFFEASFLANGLFVRTDILLKEEEGWRIVEVKSSSSVKPEHLEDVAFQWVVLEAAGHCVIGAEIMHINREWRAGDGAETFFARKDVTEDCRKLVAKTSTNAVPILAAIQSTEPPAVVLNTFCKDCGYFSHCQEEPLKDDIIFLPSIRREQVAKLRAEGINRIGDIPDDFKWTDRQTRVREAIQSQGPVIDPTLCERLDEIRFPAAFIDFETCMWARPPWNGLRPYEAVPFQWSMHWMEEDGTAHHEEFLAEGDIDPRAEFAQRLHVRMKDAASVVFYSSFEIQQISWLAKAEIPFAAELHEVIANRGVDLLKLIQESVYLHDFRGSFSIKSVLPALVPDLSYKKLRVQNGDMAVQEFKRLLSEALTPDRKQEIRDALLEYCKLDTLAMVRIYQELRALSVGPPASNP